MNQSNLRLAYAVLLISLFNIFTFLALFLLRSLDNNRLTSWKWVFAHIDVVPFFSILIAGVAVAFVLSKLSFLERHPTSLFLSSFFMASILWGEPEVIVDAARYFTQAKHLNAYGIGYFVHEWGRDIKAWTDLPLVPFLYGLIFKLFGEQRLYIQIFTTLLFSLTVVLTYMIGKRLWDRDTGYYAAWLLCGIPYLFTQVPLMLVDVPTMFFFTLAIFSVINALEQGGAIRIAVSSIAVFLAFFCKYSTWLWLTVLIIVFVVYLRREPEKTIKRGTPIALLLFVLVSAVIFLRYDLVSDQIALLMSYQRPGLRRWGESFVSTFFFQIHPFITIAAVYSIYCAFRRKDLTYVIIIYLIVLMILLWIERIRYIIPLFPMLTLLASYGLREVRDREIKRFILFCIVASSFILAIAAYFPFLQRTSAANIKNAARFMSSLDVKNIEVFTLPQERSVINPAVSIPILDLFTDKGIIYDMELHSDHDWRRVRRSSLRFTWEYRNPRYYRAYDEDAGQVGAIVIISASPQQSIPDSVARRTEQYRNYKIFKTFTGYFRYRTILTVFYE